MVKPKTPAPPEFAHHYQKVTELIEGVKIDNLTQFGEIKKEFGSISHQLDNHQGRITKLEEDKLKRDAIEEYKQAHPEVAQGVFDKSAEEYNRTGGVINKELLQALKYLGLVIGIMAAAIIALKVKF